MKKKVTKSIFGRDIDERCPGCSWFGKLLVFLGIFADGPTNEWCSSLDEELDRLVRKNILQAE